MFEIYDLTDFGKYTIPKSKISKPGKTGLIIHLLKWLSGEDKIFQGKTFSGGRLEEFFDPRGNRGEEMKEEMKEGQ